MLQRPPGCSASSTAIFWPDPISSQLANGLPIRINSLSERPHHFVGYTVGKAGWTEEL